MIRSPYTPYSIYVRGTIGFQLYMELVSVAPGGCTKQDYTGIKKFHSRKGEKRLYSLVRDGVQALKRLSNVRNFLYWARNTAMSNVQSKPETLRAPVYPPKVGYTKTTLNPKSFTLNLKPKTLNSILLYPEPKNLKTSRAQAPS